MLSVIHILEVSIITNDSIIDEIVSSISGCSAFGMTKLGKVMILERGMKSLFTSWLTKTTLLWVETPCDAIKPYKQTLSSYAYTIFDSAMIKNLNTIIRFNLFIIDNMINIILIHDTECYE